MEIKITYNEIVIIDYCCWRCGTKENLTESHSIPLHMKPKKNIKYPLCRKCHDELHIYEGGTTKKFLYKIYKELEGGISKLNFLKFNVEKHEKDLTIADVATFKKTK